MGVHHFVLTILLMWAAYMFLIAEHVISDPVVYSLLGAQITLSQAMTMWSLLVAFIAFKHG